MKQYSNDVINGVCALTLINCMLLEVEQAYKVISYYGIMLSLVNVQRYRVMLYLISIRISGERSRHNCCYCVANEEYIICKQIHLRYSADFVYG